MSLKLLGPSMIMSGICRRSKAIRAASRKIPSVGQAIAWNRQATSAYTWVRTNRGPLQYWLHHIGKSDSPLCVCSPPTIQDGHHVTFLCPHLDTERQRLLRGRTTWEALDSPLYIRDHLGDEAYEATEEFFSHVFSFLTS